MNDTQEILIKEVFSNEELEQQQKEELIIDTINNFVQLMRSIKTEKQLFEEDLRRKEGITNDFLHVLELCELTEQEEKELLDKERINRRERRIIKDNLDILTPIMDYIANDSMYKLIGDMSNLVGNLRKIKRGHENRVYKKREDGFSNTPFVDLIDN